MQDRRPTVIILAICALAWGGIVLHRARDRLANDIFEPTATQGQVEAFARQRLSQLQERSFAEDVEQCGLVAERGTGEIMSRTVMIGREDSCDVQWFNVSTLYPLATFHTHAAYNPDYDSEVPSTLDLESAVAGQLDGYVATPGGRLWHLDWQAGMARQVCGENCLPQDRAYRPCAADEPASEYSMATLRERQSRVWNGC
ncbi:MAG: DUF4329 domain-containing protein [Erythrobacter sp.]|nr:DUF4329 domain-containing protein [Erythrobacter sp.]